MYKRLEQTKQHLIRNKNTYIVGASCLAVGAMLSPSAIQIVDSMKIQIWSPTTNNVQQIVLARRGHPGNIILCKETGEKFASQARAASVNEVNPSTLSKHLSGALAHAGGRTFENLGEAS